MSVDLKKLVLGILDTSNDTGSSPRATRRRLLKALRKTDAQRAPTIIKKGHIKKREIPKLLKKLRRQEQLAHYLAHNKKGAKGGNRNGST